VGGSGKRRSVVERVPARLTEDTFWEIIATFDWSRRTEDAVVRPAMERLAAGPVRDIRQFEEIMSRHLYEIDGKRWAREIGKYAWRGDDEFFSVDLFLYARCYVVAQGRAFFQAVRRDPHRMPKNKDFETLLYVASRAYKKKTGREFTHVPKKDYETFCNSKQWR
jgi:Protein of unknown function (DUF4240)